MDDFYQKKVTIKKSNSGHNIVTVGNTELHSSFNPVKEAYDLTQKYQDKLKIKNKILILGLGAGYHIQQLDFKIREFKKNYEICVIEPNLNIVKTCRELHVLPNEHIKILSGETISNYYNNQWFVDFLTDKPLIIPHPQSFNLNESFYAKFLSFKASRKNKNIQSILTNQETISYLQRFPSELLIEEILELTERKELLNKEDMFFKAFNTLIDHSVEAYHE